MERFDTVEECLFIASYVSVDCVQAPVSRPAARTRTSSSKGAGSPNAAERNGTHAGPAILKRS
jgi:hypothetical protein